MIHVQFIVEFQVSTAECVLLGYHGINTLLSGPRTEASVPRGNDLKNLKCPEYRTLTAFHGFGRVRNFLQALSL